MYVQYTKIDESTPGDSLSMTSLILVLKTSSDGEFTTFWGAAVPEKDGVREERPLK